MHKLSIITVNLNNSKGLRNTVNSLLTQSDHQFEWVLIDGGSTDESISMLHGITPKFGMIVNSEIDEGIYDAMNRGVQLSSSEYLLFLNSGDFFLSHDAVAMVKHALAQNHGVDMILFGFKYLLKIRAPRPLWWRYWSLPTSHQAIVYNRELLRRIPYESRLRYAADFENFLKICSTGANIFSSKMPLIENERYGSNSNISKVKDEYLEVLKIYLPGPIASFLNAVKFYYIRSVI